MNHHYQNYNAYAGPSRPPHEVEAIPAPVPKSSYEAPVFRTFQDRKRAKELALRQEVAPPSPPVAAPMLPPAQSRPLPRPASTSPLPSPHSPSHVPTAPPRSPVQATIERSDTVSSIRSLDRVGFSPGRRPLPAPPVGVNVSRSLDRGVPGNTRRKQPSTVAEEDELSNYSSRATTPIPTINIPVINSPSQPPASPSDIPSVNLPTFQFDEPDDQPRDNIVMTGLPVISVSSEETRPERIQADGAILCAGCGEPIIGRIVNAMKRRFHPACFRCEECGEHLEHVSSYEWEGRAYCHLDYHDKFAHRCHHCKTPIVDPRFVTLKDDALGQRFYHELHFFCSECGDPFLDPSKSSAPGANGNDEDVETNAFVVHRGHPYCEKCHLRLHKPKCRACAQPIPDIAVNALGAKWHQGCFCCSNCQRQLSNLFFPKDGNALCTECFEAIGQHA